MTVPIPALPDSADVTDLSVLANGRNSGVFRGVLRSSGRRVAVKVAERSLTGVEQRQRFLDHARAVASVSGHRAVADLLGFGFTDDQRPFVVLELADGSYADPPAPGPSPEEVATVGAAVADALAVAHAAGLVHGDVRPGAILRTAAGPRLGGFRASSGVDGEQPAAPDSAFGAPERLWGIPPSPAGDVYALCATLYALLAGRPPRQPGRQVSLAQLRDVYDAPLADPPGAAPAFADLLRQGLSYDPAQRPTATEVHDRLAAHAGQPAGAASLQQGPELAGAATPAATPTDPPAATPTDLRADSPAATPADIPGAAMPAGTPGAPPTVPPATDLSATDLPTADLPAVSVPAGPAPARLDDAPAVRPRHPDPVPPVPFADEPTQELPVRPPVRRRPRTVAAAVAVAVLLLLGVGVWLGVRDTRAPQARAGTGPTVAPLPATSAAGPGRATPTPRTAASTRRPPPSAGARSTRASRRPAATTSAAPRTTSIAVDSGSRLAGCPADADPLTACQVRRAYTLTLGRPYGAGDGAADEAWAQLPSEKDLRRSLADSTEAGTRITALYRGCLLRAPERAGLAAWRDSLAAGASMFAVARGIATSAEARSKGSPCVIRAAETG